MAETDDDLFKQEFKRFRKPTKHDLAEVIDFDQLDKFDEINQIVPQIHSNEHLVLGLTPPQKWQAFNLKSKPGLIVIRNPFLPGHQHRWVVQCLVKYPLLPNVCNLDSHMTRAGEGKIWLNESDSTNFDISKDSLLYKLRWVTLGYHYNWTTKLYDPKHFSIFPDDLAHLSQFVLGVIGFLDFKAEAAIVNYYHMDSTLSGHTDHSEKDLTAPLISFSFGQSAIFLIGGHTKQERPLSLYLHSGDIVVMSGESRLAYHAVPKIIDSSSVDGFRVPRCLSKELFQSAILDRKDNLQICCSLCGYSTKYLKSDDITSEKEERQLYKRKRKDMPGNNKIPAISSNAFDSNFPDENKDIEKPKAYIRKQSLELIVEDKQPVASNFDHKGMKVTETKLVCRSCQWIFENWINFETYLSFSRININVRQVGNI